MKKWRELKDLPAQGLQERLLQSQQELMKLRVQLATGATSPNPGKVKNTKKTIAFLRACLSKKEGHA